MCGVMKSEVEFLVSVYLVKKFKIKSVVMQVSLEKLAGKAPCILVIICLYYLYTRGIFFPRAYVTFGYVTWVK